MELKEVFGGRLQWIDTDHFEEDGKKQESLAVNGLFAISDFLNSNSRRYPMKVLQQAVAKMQNEIQVTGPVFSLDGHPKGGDDLKLSNVSHSIAEVWQDEDNPKEFYCNLQILPSTAGRNLWTILKHGGAVGLSMRGTGEVKNVMEGGKKIEVVESFVLQGIDTVLNPSFSTARVNKGDVIGESLSTDTRRSDVQEAKNWKKWVSAKEAGFVGSFETYKERVLGVYKLTPTEQKLYEYSRIAGSKMSPTEFKKKIILKQE